MTGCWPEPHRSRNKFPERIVHRLYASDGNAGAHIDTVQPVLGFVEPRQGVASDPSQHAVERFQGRDVLPGLGQHCGRSNLV